MRDLLYYFKINEYEILGCLAAQRKAGFCTSKRYWYDNTVYCDICGKYQEYKDWKNYKMCNSCRKK